MLWRHQRIRMHDINGKCVLYALHCLIFSWIDRPFWSDFLIQCLSYFNTVVILCQTMLSSHIQQLEYVILFASNSRTLAYEGI